MFKMDVTGTITVKNYLNRKHYINVTFNKTIKELDIINFHNCVDKVRLENENTVTFFSQEGLMLLSTYRKVMNDTQNAPFRMFWEFKKTTDFVLEGKIRLRSDFKPKVVAKDIFLSVPLPKDIHSCSFEFARDFKDTKKTIESSCKFNTGTGCIEWELSNVPGGMEQALAVKIVMEYRIPDDASIKKFIPAIHLLKFELPAKTLSRLKLQNFDLGNSNSTKWIKYATNSSGGYSSRFIK